MIGPVHGREVKKHGPVHHQRESINRRDRVLVSAVNSVQRQFLPNGLPLMDDSLLSALNREAPIDRDRLGVFSVDGVRKEKERLTATCRLFDQSTGRTFPSKEPIDQ